MKPETVTYLNSLNRQFYETTASAFDETRQHPWDGWERLRANLPAARPLRVLDVGCGNGRFGVFLADELSAMTYHGMDNNPTLLGYARDVLQGRPGITTTFSQQDIVADGLAVTGDYDLVVLFGVIHHVPGAAKTAPLCSVSLPIASRRGGCWRLRPGGSWIIRVCAAKRLTGRRTWSASQGIICWTGGGVKWPIATAILWMMRNTYRSSRRQG